MLLLTSRPAPREDPRLALRTRTLVGNCSRTGVSNTVACPTLERTVSLEDCSNCAHFGSVLQAPSKHARILCHDASQSIDRAPENGELRVSAVMIRDVICVERELELTELARLLLDRHISGAPVVDEAWRLLGAVSKTDLLRTQHDRGQLVSGVVADIMTPVVFSLAESAPLSRAAALMAYEGVHRIPIVSETGEVVGLVTSTDVVRWVAMAAGYMLHGRG